MTITTERSNADTKRRAADRQHLDLDTEIIETRNGVRHILALAAWPEARRIARALKHEALAYARPDYDDDEFGE